VGTLVAGTAPRDVAHAGYVLLSLLFLRQREAAVEDREKVKFCRDLFARPATLNTGG
jgi:hypothetical protein